MALPWGLDAVRILAFGWKQRRSDLFFGATGNFAQRRAEIHTVICDLRMPHMDGLVLVQALRRMSAQCRIVVMSGNIGERQSAELKTLNVSAVLPKPFAAKDLIETLKSLFEKTADSATKP